MKPYLLYKHIDIENNLLYVGVTNNLDKRTEEHSRTAKWFNAIHSISCIEFPNKATALNAERLVISIEQPKYNTVYKTYYPLEDRYNETLEFFDISCEELAMQSKLCRENYYIEYREYLKKSNRVKYKSKEVRDYYKLANSRIKTKLLTVLGDQVRLGIIKDFEFFWVDVNGEAIRYIKVAYTNKQGDTIERIVNKRPLEEYLPNSYFIETNTKLKPTIPQPQH